MDDMPVYLFTGFLESGKTSFIDETLADKRFNNGQRTLLLVCEEGEAEYDESRPYMKNIYVENIEDEDELTSETLDILAKKHRASRVLIEYNGMWQLKTLYDNMPENWAVYQEFMFADATTFLTYNANMRGLVVDKLSGCELVVFNRFTKDMDKMAFHKIVRGISRRPDIAYEYTNGDVEYDEIEDPLPFDVEADTIELEDRDYAYWYQDIMAEPDVYKGKTMILSASHSESRPANWISSTQQVISWRPKKNMPGFMRGFTAARPLYSTTLPSYFFGSSERSRYHSA